MNSWNALIVVVLLGANVLGWAALNRPVEEQPWLGVINGVSFSPFRQGQNPEQDPEKATFPTPEQLDADLALVSGSVKQVRTYSAHDAFAQIPALARKHGLKVTAGAWISPIEKDNDDEISRLVRMANANGNVHRVLVGNEALLRKDVTADQLIGYIEAVRRQVKVPVSTSEPWHIWLKYPRLADHVQYIGVHILPYWEGMPVEKAVEHTIMRLREIREAFPGKPVVLTEVGWPSGGRIRRDAVPSDVNQAMFLREFLNVAEREKLDYFVVEAFDQPWKMAIEGGAGGYWGLFDADRNPKVPFVGPLVPIENWPLLAAASAALALLPLIWFLRRQEFIAFQGRLFFGGLIQMVGCAAIWTGYVYASQYLTTLGTAVLAVMSGLLCVLILVLLAEGLELTEVLWRRRFLRRPVTPLTPPDGPLPKVSIHVPICNEPPGMVIETLRSLARLDYPDYEVLVIDNNTPDEATWRPVESFCATLGPRFRFFHVGQLDGFKAGALNFALRETSPDVDIVGVIDSDYMVEPDWLRALVPMFADREIAIVQAPQDYRDGVGSVFKRMCFWEYAGFFHFGMVQRNERNAIIQHGTMTLVRRPALETVGGWGEWCICEDAELGLRIFEAGHKSLYINRSFGRGLTPDSFSGYQKQRFRWAYGAVQILKRHWRPLVGLGATRLTMAQRYHFLAGWLPWLADAANLLFTCLGLLWTLGLVIWPDRFEYPLQLFLLAALSFFGFKVVKTIWLYRVRIKLGWADTVGAAVAGLALSHTVAKAVLSGIVTGGRPFLRTPKCENQPALLRGLTMAWQETALMLLLTASAVAIAIVHGREEPEAMYWSALLAAQALPHAAALLLSMVNVLPAALARRPVPAAALANQA